MLKEEMQHSHSRRQDYLILPLVVLNCFLCVESSPFIILIHFVIQVLFHGKDLNLVKIKGEKNTQKLSSLFSKKLPIGFSYVTA